MMKRRQFIKLGLSALAATTLSLKQVGWPLTGIKNTDIKNTDIFTSTDFENYVLSEINKMPERQVGRIIKIETLRDTGSFSPLLRGLNVNRYFKGGKYWACLYDPDSINDLHSKKKFVKDLAFQLRLAFRT